MLGLPVQVVGKEFGPSRLATLVCDIGQRFSEPIVTVSFTPEAIAQKVFEEAYGNAAGGDPIVVDSLGDRAFVRTEADVRSVHVLVHGAMLSVRTSLEPLSSRGPVPQPELIALAEAAVAAVPDNPAPPKHDNACPRISSGSIKAAIGRSATMATQWTMADGSLMCSWGAQPGSATVEILRDQQAITEYRQTHHLADYLDLGDLGAGPGTRALSSVDTAGDLVILARDQALVLITVVASAGYAYPSIATTDGERLLAQNALAMLA